MITFHRNRRNILSFTLFFIPVVHQPQNGDTLHKTGCGVAQKLAAGLECSINANFMLRRCKEIARLRRVVGGLFGDVVGAGSVGIVPVAGEGLSKNGVKRLLHSSMQVSDCAPRQTASGRLTVV